MCGIFRILSKKVIFIYAFIKNIMRFRISYLFRMKMFRKGKQLLLICQSIRGESMITLQRTPLFDVYAKYGGKTIDFGGWELPVQFSSIKEEHEAVRTAAGLFDVSHMGEVEVKGVDSLAFLQRVVTNDVSTLKVGGAQYTAMCYENGGTVDDLLIYKRGEEDYLLVINASNIEKDYEWLASHVIGDATVVNVSSEVAQLAIQGPKAEGILQKLCQKI